MFNNYKRKKENQYKVNVKMVQLDGVMKIANMEGKRNYYLYKVDWIIY